MFRACSCPLPHLIFPMFLHHKSPRGPQWLPFLFEVMSVPSDGFCFAGPLPIMKAALESVQTAPGGTKVPIS